MDKAEATRVMREAEAALDTVFAAHGLRRKSLRLGFDAGMVRITAVGESTDPALDPKVTDWHRYAAGYGLPEDALGREVTLNRKRYTITGLDMGRRKYPITVAEVGTGKSMLFTVAGIKRALGLPVEAWER